jgi:hypothetical protein
MWEGTKQPDFSLHSERSRGSRIYSVSLGAVIEAGFNKRSS